MKEPMSTTGQPLATSITYSLIALISKKPQTSSNPSFNESGNFSLSGNQSLPKYSSVSYLIKEPSLQVLLSPSVSLQSIVPESASGQLPLMHTYLLSTDVTEVRSGKYSLS